MMLARLTEDFRNQTAALPFYERVIAAKSSDVAALYFEADAYLALGRIKLSSDQEDGIAAVRQAIAADGWKTIAGCDLVLDYLARNGREKDMAQWRQRLETRVELERAAEAERTLTPNDSFIAHGLDRAVVTRFQKALATLPDLKRAYLVRKAVNHFPEYPLFVLAFQDHTGWLYTYDDSDKYDEPFQRIVAEVGFTGDLRAIFLDRSDAVPFRRRIVKVPGALIYRRGASVSVGSQKPSAPRSVVVSADRSKPMKPSVAEPSESALRQPNQAFLDRLLAKAASVQILAGGMDKGQPLEKEVLAQVNNREALALLKKAIRIADGAAGRCACPGGPTLKLLDQDGKRLALLCLHHGQSVRLSRWNDDARLIEGIKLLEWLADCGVPQPLQDYRSKTGMTQEPPTSSPAAEAVGEPVADAGESKNAQEYFEQCRQAAEQGDAEAQFRFGGCYALGNGIAKNMKEAASWYRRAADQGHAEAQNTLGWMYFAGLGMPQNHKEAVVWFRRAADQGHVQAQMNLGMMYGEGKGLQKSLEEAVAWCRRSAEQGYALAEYNLGVSYAKGEGVSQDFERAVAWLRRAAAPRSSPASVVLAALLNQGRTGPARDEYEELGKWLSGSGEQGFAPAQFALGSAYVNGSGVPRDFGEAVAWFRRAADQGYPHAQDALGLLYSKGEGVPQDHEEAARWFKLAADQGYAEAQFHLGADYVSHDRAQRDYLKAALWLRKAADQGHAAAQYTLGMLYCLEESGVQDAKEVVKWFRASAQQEFPRAQFRLGMMYLRGEGVPQDPGQGVRWIRRAAELGDAEAQTAVGLLHVHGNFVPQSYGAAAKWFRAAADQGYADAQFHLGVMHVGGEGVTQDFDEAVRWFRLAAEQGHADAAQNLRAIEPNIEELKSGRLQINRAEDRSP